MFGWLFGKKKKVNTRNKTKSALLKTELKRYSQKEKVQSLRRLKAKYPYDVDFDLMYADDQLEDVIMLYLLMDMVYVVSEEDAGFYEDTETEIEDSFAEEVTEDVVADLEEME